MESGQGTPTRRQLLNAVYRIGGTAAAYSLMTTLGHAAESQFTGPPKLSGARKGASVLVLGAGLAGMVAAYELEKAGYKVRILEYQDRAGGRNWSLYGGDSYAELGGAVQKVGFAKGNYLNPGPWRIPHHHRSVLHYCKAFGVALEPFIQLNHNAYLHSVDAFGGRPQRYKALAADFEGHVAELLAGALDKKGLDAPLTAEDAALLKTALRDWGVLDADMRYVKGVRASMHRGFDRPPGGGVYGAPTPSDLLPFGDVLKSGVWDLMGFYMDQEYQTTMFQPVGGMGMIGKAFARQVGRLVTYNAKVTRITQDKIGVTVGYVDMTKGNAAATATADFCVCTIPLPVLSQIQTNLNPKLQRAIRSVPYSNSVKIGLEMRRRFWEQDDDIYGGHSFTDQEISLISYPNHGFFEDRPAVLLGAYAFGPAAFRMAGMTPEARIEAALAQGEAIHGPVYRKEFLSGVSVAWSRVPWAMGCCAEWDDEVRKAVYQDLVALDDRVVLAGEHASYLSCWMEGALLSSLDAITRLHKRALEA
jgi:monoamine oxidase